MPPSSINLTEQLRFERFISELSARFINLPGAEVDSRIEQGLKEMVEFLDVDRCALMQFSENQNELVMTHVYARQGIPPMPNSIKLDKTLFPWLSHKIMRGEVFAFSSLNEFPAKAKSERKFYALFNIKSNVTMPLSVGGAVQYVMTLGAIREERTWSADLIGRLRLIGEILVNALDRRKHEEKLQQSFKEIRKLKEQLEAENLYLRESMSLEGEWSEMIGKSPAIQRVLAQVKKVARTDSTVLIEGETGVGKELIARAIHKLSDRQNKAMITVNCATLPTALIESELFGRETGAYTGALSRQCGRFEVADGSTIFLDEIGELSLEVQAKLLRVLQDGTFERLGSPKEINVDVRVVAATNRNLEEEVHKGYFRKDLYYRLRVFPVRMPPLRERKEDIPMLVRLFIDEFGRKMGKTVKSVSRKSLDDLQRYSWPGNIRELRNVVEYAMILCSDPKLIIPLPKEPVSDNSTLHTLEETERRYILEILETTNWRIKGATGAAEILGLKPSTLYFKMKKMNIPTRYEKGT